MRSRTSPAQFATRRWTTAVRTSLLAQCCRAGVGRVAASSGPIRLPRACYEPAWPVISLLWALLGVAGCHRISRHGCTSGACWILRALYEMVQFIQEARVCHVGQLSVDIPTCFDFLGSFVLQVCQQSFQESWANHWPANTDPRHVDLTSCDLKIPFLQVSRYGGLLG